MGFMNFVYHAGLESHGMLFLVMESHVTSDTFIAAHVKTRTK